MTDSIRKRKGIDPKDLLTAYKTMPKILEGLGFNKLRAGQDKAVASVLSGNDTLVILPTGRGKSAVYIVPTLVNKWKTVIFSPLIALMQDQLESLQRKGLRAGQLSSIQTPKENEIVMLEWLHGELDFLLAAPERLRNVKFMEVMSKVKPDMVTVDECFTGDVELLTNKGFKRFDELTQTEIVAQVNSDTGAISFVTPTRFIKNRYKGTLVSLKSLNTIDLNLTENHEIVFYTNNEPKAKKLKVKDFKPCQTYQFATAATYKGNNLINNLDTIAKFKLMFYFHGFHDFSGTTLFSFPDQHTVDKFKVLCDELKITYKPGSLAVPEFITFIVDTGTLKVSKCLDEVFDLTSFTQEYARSFIAELVTILPHSKACRSISYSSPTKANASFVQVVAVLAGFRSQLYSKVIDDGETFITQINLRTNKIDTRNIVKRSKDNFDGLVYCVEVPEHNIIVRRKGRPIVVGNCHTLSQWSDNFRSDYCKIGDFIDEVNPRSVLCLTATCPTEVEEDVRRVIGIPDAEKVVYMPPRLNLTYSSHTWAGDWHLQEQINSIPGSTIVYCATVAETKRLYDTIGSQIKGGSLVYNGQLKQSERATNQALFMNDHVRVMFCTNSFGMGVDKSGIRGVIHRDIPGSLENYSQESGRAGRDNQPSKCMLFFDQKSLNTQNFFISNGHPDKSTITSFYNSLKYKTNQDNICNASIKELCDHAGINSFCASALIQILYGSKVMERLSVDKVVTVKLLNDHMDDKYQVYYDAINRFGIEVDDGYLEVDLDLLVTTVGFSSVTVKKHLADLSENKYIEYTPPSKGNPIKLLGDLSLVDFERLKQKEKDAYKKLDALINFFHTPDNEKHTFLTNYFTQ